MDKILITGAYGQIGQLCLNMLLARGHAVLAMDIATKKTVALDQSLRDRFPDAKQFQSAFVDLRDSSAVKQQVLDFAPAVIVHLAAIVSPPCYSNPARAREINVGATKTLIDAALSLSAVPHFIFASSSAVYGSRNPYTRHGLITPDTPVQPIDCYGEDKVAGEGALLKSGLPFSILRLGGVVSPDGMGNLKDEYLVLVRATPRDNRIHAIDARDAALAFANAAELPVQAQNQVFLIAGDDSCRKRQRELEDDVMEAIGLGRLGDSASLPGDPADELGWSFTDWYDTADANAVLNFQQHSWPDTLDWISSSVSPASRKLLKFFGPALRTLMRGFNRVQRIRERRGRYAAPWTFMAKKYGTGILANTTIPPSDIHNALHHSANTGLSSMSTQQKKLRIVQWTTGKVASAALKAIVERPNMELVGVFAFSEEKAGQDAGQLAGLGRDLGIKATANIDDIIALAPDCVVHMPLHPDIDQMCQLLRAGINVVTTASFMTGYGYGESARTKLAQAAQEGGASLFGSGVNPGWINAVSSAASGLCKDVSLIRITESFNIGLWAADANQDVLGWGRPASDPGHAADVREATLPFGDAVEVLAAMYGIELDAIDFKVEFAHATEDLDVPGRNVKKGSVAGIHAKWLGIYRGHPVIDCSVQWSVAEEITPAWEIAMAYLVEVIGTPQVKMKIDILPDDMSLPMEELMEIGFMFPAMPVVNAIPSVVAAKPGIVTYADLKPISSIFHPKALPAQQLPMVEEDEEAIVPQSAATTNDDLSGKWQITVKGPTGPQITELTLYRENGEYTGVQSGDGMDSPVENFAFDGSNVSWLNRVSKPLKLKVTFTGRLENGVIRGKCKAGFMGKFAFEAKRIQ